MNFPFIYDFFFTRKLCFPHIKWSQKKFSWYTGGSYQFSSVSFCVIVSLKLMKKSSFPFVKDELRMAVKEAICDDEKERLKYEEALVAITVEESLRRWGFISIGEPDISSLNFRHFMIILPVGYEYFLSTSIHFIRYCQRIGRSDFWGGESELLVSIFLTLILLILNIQLFLIFILYCHVTIGNPCLVVR